MLTQRPIAPQQGFLPRLCWYVISMLSHVLAQYLADSRLLASLEVKSKAPNGVTFNVKGKSAHEGPIAGSVSSNYCFLQETLARVSANSSC